jgi:polyferredoxin
MNKITEPEEIKNKDARKSFHKLSPYILGINFALAFLVWFFRDAIFGQEENFLGSLLAGGFILAGVFSYVIFELMSKKVTRVDRPSKDDDDGKE